MATNELPPLLTLPEAAEYLRMPDYRLRNNWRRWGLHPTKAGRELRFTEADLLDWLNSSRVAS